MGVGGGEAESAVAEAGALSAAAIGAAGPPSGDAGRHAQNAAPAKAPHAPTLSANILIRERFFQNPIVLRGTSTSLQEWTP